MKLTLALEVVLVAPKSGSRAVQRQIDLTTAVCQERILATHVRHALALVDIVSDSLPFDDALDIYVRILRLNAEQARNVGSRALAELGRRSGLPSRIDELNLESALEPEEEPRRDDDEQAEHSEGRSEAIFARLRRRMQGRVKADLRHRINLAAARVEDDLFETHVENALLFVKALSDEMSPPQAVDLYLETMVLPEGLGDVVYNRALRTIADQMLPTIPQPSDVRIAVDPAQTRHSVPAQEPGARSD